MFCLKRKTVASTLLTLIALAFIAVNLSNQQNDHLSTTLALPSTASPSPTPQPTPIPTPTPPEPTISFTLWYTNSPVIQLPADRLADIPPICEIVSPENQTVLQTSNFTLNVNVASYFWIIDSVYYEADWIEGIHQIFDIQPNYVDALNASITVNFTEIPNGNHTVTVYANTHDGSHSFATVIFQIASLPSPSPSPSPSPMPSQSPLTVVTPSSKEPFPTATVAAVSGALAVVVVAGLLVYFKKRKR